MIQRSESSSPSKTQAEILSEQNMAAIQAFEAEWTASQKRLLDAWEVTAITMSQILQNALNNQIQDLFSKLTQGLDGFAGEWVNVFGEQLGKDLSSAITSSLSIVNVIDPSFVSAAIESNPQTVINVINDDIIKNGSTRKTIQSHV